MSNIPNLDLHGVKHEDVMMIVEEWAIIWDLWVLGFQGKIITGNSTKMKTLAISALKKHLFDYKILGDGSILVSGTI
jgi:hypothetical protein